MEIETTNSTCTVYEVVRIYVDGNFGPVDSIYTDKSEADYRCHRLGGNHYIVRCLLAQPCCDPKEYFIFISPIDEITDT